MEDGLSRSAAGPSDADPFTDKLTAAGTASRQARLSALLEARGLAALILRRPQNFAWYTNGADNRVDRTAPAGAAALLVMRDRAAVVSKDIEAERMRREVTPELEVVAVPWTESLDGAVARISGGTVGSDLPFAGAADVTDDVAVLRRTLDADAIARYPAIGAAARAAVDEVAAAVTAGLDEHEVAAALEASARRRGLHATVVIAAADARIALFRHPMPTGRVIERRCMIVLSAERGGLHANVTRFVDLAPPDAGTTERMRVCAQLRTEMRACTRPGRSLADVFGEITRLYADAGYPEGWRAHHQGGVTGYAGREELATPTSPHRIAAGQAFAWNPSLPGAKAEETFLLLESGPLVIAD